MKTAKDCEGKTLKEGDDVVIKRDTEVQGRVLEIHGTYSATIAVWNFEEDNEVTWGIDTKWKCWRDNEEDK